MYAIIVFGIIAIVVVVALFAYQNKQNAARELQFAERQYAEKTKGIDTLPSSAYQRIRDKEQDDLKNKRGVGELLDPCPCAEGFECSVGDGNICKVKEGGTCRVTSDCSSSSFCFNALCTVKPDVEGDRLILRNTPMLLQSNRFTVPRNWWKFTDIVDICQCPKEANMYYLLNDQGRIFKVDINPKVNGTIEISQVTKMESIFFYDKHYYGISKGFLYQLENENDRVWNWGKVNKLYGECFSPDNFLGEEVFEASTVDDLLILSTDKGTFQYEKSKNEWSIFEEDIKRIVYGRTRNYYIKETKDRKIIYHQNGKEHELDDTILDYAVSRDNDHIIYLLYPNNTAYINIYDRKEGGADDVSIRILGKVNRIFTFKDHLWALSINERFDFVRNE